MSFSKAALSQAERDLVTNDKPLLIASNLLDSTVNAAWLNQADLSGTSKTATGFPVTRAYDRYSHLQTKPDPAATDHYLAFDVGTSGIDFDCFYIGGHNLGTINISSLSVAVSDGGTFASVETIYSNTSVDTDKRILALNLHDTASHTDPYRYSSVRYIRLLITASGTMIPQIGEVWFGRRRHLPRKFERELDDLRTGSDINQFISRSGVTTNYVLNRGRQTRVGTTVVDTAADVGTVTDFWDDTEQGSRPFIYCENPGSAPDDCQVMSTDPELSFPLVGPTSRNLTLTMTETAPYLALES